MGQRKIYILSNFSQYLKSYSPIIVVGSQLTMLKRAGYEPVLIAEEGWNPPEDSIFGNVETHRIPHVDIDGEFVDEKFDRDVDTLYEALRDSLDDESVILTHDLIFLPDYVKLQVACRRIADEVPSISWLHWVHSATSPEQLIKERAMFAGKYAEHLAEKFPNSLVCYPNAYDIPRVAANYNYEENEIVEVPHCTDPTEGMSYLVRKLYDDLKLGDPRALMIYPVRLDRGKYVEACIHLMGGFKDHGVTSHLIVCDFQSTGGDKVTYREELKGLARELGVYERVTFLSEFDDSAVMEVSHSVILELFTLSNVFILPSKSETYSLIAQEAMLKGNLCLLNHDFGPFRQIYGKNALYKQFDGANIAFDGFNGTIESHHTPIKNYYQAMASSITYYLENEHVLRAKTWVRTQRNPDKVFRDFIEPLLNVEEIQDAKVLGDTPGILGTGASPVGSFGTTPFPGQDSPAGDQVGY